MTLLCIEYKVVSVSYFMDVMQPFELNILLDNMGKSVKSDWERTRQLCYSIVQVNSKKHLKPSDVMKLPWDNDTKKVKKNVDTDALNKLAAKMKEMNK